LLYCLPCSAFLFLQKILLLHQSWFNIKEAAPFWWCSRSTGMWFCG
jgi:hypothetical protein